MRLSNIITASILALTLSIPAAIAEDTKIVFVAGRPSHAPGDHEHRAGCMLLAKSLNENVEGVNAVTTHYGWPKDDAIFDGADTVVMYCDGGKGHMVNRHMDEFGELIKAGVGLVCLHYAVETPKGKEGDTFLDWLGGYFETDWSVNPHWTAQFKKLPDHPITSGVKPFEINDEWYYHMRFREGMEGVTPILTAMPGEDTLTRPDGPHSGNPHVRKAVANGEEQHVAWAFDRPDGGRSFGFTGGHYHKSWQHDDVRKLVLNAICWTAKMDIPEEGIESPTPTDEEMEANLDDKKKR